MNERDRDNYAFLMNVTNEVFDDWLDQADNDDVEYALELIATARKEMAVREKLLRCLNEPVEVEPETEQILQKYMIH